MFAAARHASRIASARAMPAMPRTGAQPSRTFIMTGGQSKGLPSNVGFLGFL